MIKADMVRRIEIRERGPLAEGAPDIIARHPEEFAALCAKRNVSETVGKPDASAADLLLAVPIRRVKIQHDLSPFEIFEALTALEAEP